MANINLYQNEQEERVVQTKMIDTGLVMGVVFFLIVLAGYGGIQFYLRSLDQKIKESQAEEVSGKELLNGEDVDLATSFQQRMDILKNQKETFAKNDPAKLFLEIQKSIIGGVVASDIDFKDKVVKLSFLADNFEILAKQIMSFKNNSAFRNIGVESSTRDEDGKVKAVLNMELIF